MTLKSVLQIFIISGICFLNSCSNSEFDSNRLIYNLSGNWQFALDSSETGINEKWVEKELAEEVKHI